MYPVSFLRALTGFRFLVRSILTCFEYKYAKSIFRSQTRLIYNPVAFKFFEICTFLHHEFGIHDFLGIYTSISSRRQPTYAVELFQRRKKYSFLQRGRKFLIIQWVCQVTILVADTVESWKVFASHLKKSCNIFRVLSLSVLFFQACNLLAIVTIVLETPVKRGNREFSTKLKIFAVLALGLTAGSVTMWWYNCFSSQNYSQMALKATVFASVIVVILLVSMAARNTSI